MTFDLVVVGGGILGLSHAAAAVARGLSVAVVERAPAAAGATVRNFGLLTQLYNDGGGWGRRAARSRALYEGWAQAGGLTLNKTGSLALAQSPAQATLARAFVSTRAGAGVTLLSRQEARDMCPALGQDAPIHAALHFHDDALLEPRVLARSLPAYLASSGLLTTFYNDSAVSLHGVGGSAVVKTRGGRVLTGAAAVVATGEDVAGLFPRLLDAEASNLQLCKLQMMRLALPPSLGALTMPVTSGLSLRRYPALAAACPVEHAAMMACDAEGADPRAEALGIHVIARPAAALLRGPWGEVVQPSAGQALHLQPHEAVVGDSHQYAPVSGPGADGLDECCDEGVTDEILRVTSRMLGGVSALHEQRGGTRGQEERGPAARVLSQWQGVYAQHKDGVLAATLTLALDGPQYEREPVDAHPLVGAGAGARVRVITGIGGKGMTMGPAMGEEGIRALFGL